MRAVVLREPGKPALVEAPDPEPGPEDVIVEVDACGICGTDIHIYEGGFPPTPYPIVPGHEFCGEVVAAGAAADVPVGRFVAVDPSLFCGRCRECRLGRGNLCRDWGAIGVTVDGAFAQYVRAPVRNVYALPEGVPTTWGTIIEPLSCAIHAMDRLGSVLGSAALVYGAGTMGLLFAQVLRRGGASRVDVVDLVPESARDRAAARGGRDERAGRRAGAPSLGRRGRRHGSTVAIEDGLTRVARGGTFLVFGVAPREAAVRFSPFSIYNDGITVLGSMAVLHSFGRAIEAVGSGAVDPEPLLTHRLPLERFDEAIALARSGEALKIQTRSRGG